MDDLLAIGRFSQLTQLTVKALRLYDERGLLEPAVVDFQTGFRYYRLDQLPAARRIRLLRSLEMPLEEVQAVIGAPDSVAARALLARHRQRIEERIAGYQGGLRSLQVLDDEYQRIEREGPMEPVRTSEHQCSFCGKAQREVKRMIAGPNGVIICSECVTLCNEMIAQEEQEATSA